MTIYSALLLAAAGLAAADTLVAMNLGEASGRGLTVGGLGSSSFGVHSVSDSCGVGMTTCDTNCMPSTGICCGLGNGAYCESGYACESDGCCPDGETCSGPPTGCPADRDLCGDFCVPQGTCTTNGGGGGGGSGGCPTGYVACDDECMPSGSVCCHNGYHCNAGQTCTSNFECQIGGGGGGGSGGGSGGNGGGDQTTAPGGLGGSPTSYSLSPNPDPTAAPTESNPFGGGDTPSTTDSGPVEPTLPPAPTESNPFGGGDTPSTTDSGPVEPTLSPAPTSSSSSSDGNGNGNGGNNGGSGGNNGGSGGSSGSSSGDKGGKGGSGGTINTPSLLVGLLALVPFVL